MADERWKECKHHHDGCACREHAWAEQVERLTFELDVEKSNYECIKGEFNRAVALAQEHCPKPVLGQAWLTDGIPLLAERAKRAEAEVERLNELVDHVQEESGWRDCAALEAEVERLKVQQQDAFDAYKQLAEKLAIAMHQNMELEAEVERLKGETYCAYCGERFPLDALDSCEQIGNHIKVCPKHPMRAVEAQRDVLARRVKLAVNEWCSCGGRGPDDEDACSACHVLHMVFEGEVS